MKNILKAVILGGALLVTPFAHAQRTLEPIVNYENQEIRTASGKTPSQAQVKAAIEQAAKAGVPSARGQVWDLKEVAPGQLVGTLDVRGKHTVMVSITFSPTAYSVTYKDSVNMHYGPAAEMERDPSSPILIRAKPTGQFEIHPYYNRWVKALVNNIRLEIKKL